MVTADTKLIGLLGYPLKQTFSPQMQNEAYSRLHLDYFYLPIEVRDHLKEVVTGIRHMNFAGFNVTKPIKIEIIDHLDELDELAEKVGSVNVVVVKDHKLMGYNTDGEGFVRALLEGTDVNLSKSVFFVIGAGGASRAVCFTLAIKGVKKMYIVDQLEEATSALVEGINGSTSKCAELVSFEEESFARYIAESDVLINASGVGMHPHIGESPVRKENLREHLLVADLIYNPLKSQLLLDAEERGCKTMNGIEMQIIQGALGFSLWTGLPAPIEVMRDIMSHIVARQR